MEINILQGLMKCPLFSSLKQNEIIELMHTVRYRVVRYHKGDIFTVAGTPCLHADIIIDGEMKASLIGPSGRTVRMTMHHSGNMLAPAFLFANDNLYPVTVEATTDAQVFRLQEHDMKQLLKADPRLMMNFIHILSNIIAYLTKKVGMLSMSVKEKVVVYLKELQQQQRSNDITLPLSRQELASVFAIQKYSLQRCLNELQEEGAIQIDGKHIRIINL